MTIKEHERLLWRLVLVAVLILSTLVPPLDEYYQMQASEWSLSSCTYYFEDDPYTPLGMFSYEYLGDEPAEVQYADLSGTATNPIFGEFPLWFFPGNHLRVFGFPAVDGQSLTWTVTIEGVTQSVTANASGSDCSAVPGLDAPGGFFVTKYITVSKEITECHWWYQDYDTGVITFPEEKDGVRVCSLVVENNPDDYYIK